MTPLNQATKETAMRVTRDVLAVETPIWMLRDRAYDILDWHDHLLAAGDVPVAPYTPRNTDDPKDIEYRVENRIEEYGEDVQLKHPSWTRRTTIGQESNEPTTRSRTPVSGTSVPETVFTDEQKCSLQCIRMSTQTSVRQYRYPEIIK